MNKTNTQPVGVEEKVKEFSNYLEGTLKNLGVWDNGERNKWYEEWLRNALSQAKAEGAEEVAKEGSALDKVIKWFKKHDRKNNCRLVFSEKSMVITITNNTPEV